MDAENTHEQLHPWQQPVGFEEVEQRYHEVMDTAVETRGVALDLLALQRDLWRELRDNPPVRDGSEVDTIELTHIHHKEEQLDKINQMLGRLINKDVETPEQNA